MTTPVPLMKVSTTEFRPSTAFAPTTAPAFVPSSTFTPNVKPFTPTLSKPFVPSNAPMAQSNAAPFVQKMSMASSGFTPAPVAVVPTPPPKPVEPKKEKQLLLIERIVKGSETNVKTVDISAEETEKINLI